MTGNGFLRKADGKSYRGQFKEGKLHGEGTFFVEGATYSLAGEYEDGVPVMSANKYLL